MEKLKPCPFCGGTAVFEDWEFARVSGTTVGCDSCGAYIIMSDLEDGDKGDSWHDKAVEKWNHRAIEEAEKNA